MTLRDRDERERRDRYIKATVDAVIHDIQEDLQRTLGPEGVADIDEFVRMVLVSGMDLERDDPFDDAVLP